MPTGTPQEVHALRAQLWDAGFRPVPVYNHDDAHPSAGKAPMGNAWGDEARRDPPDAVSRPAHPRALNTGLLCDGLRAIDVDVDNPTIAASIRAKALDRFGEAPMRYRDNSPRVLLLYRATEGAPPKRSIVGPMGKVEILGAGQQFVAFGVHPSGADLRWMPEPPGSEMLASLTAISEADVDVFLADVASSIGAVMLPKAANGTQASSPRGLGADPLQVVAALSAIPNNGPADWEGWNRIGMATWAATGGGEAGRAAFHAWSQAHPAYDAQATNERWDHYRTSPPTQIGAGSLFYMAKMATPVGNGRPEETPREEQEPPRAKSLPVIYFNDIRAQLDAADFVEGLLTDAAMAVVYGQSNSGKTFWTLDLALHVAAGKEWNGRAIEQRGVLWLAMEGSFGAQNRVIAWCKHHEIDAETLPFAIIPVALNLLDPEADTERLLATMAEVGAQFTIPVGWTVVDTLSRAMAGGNENAPDDMGALVTNGTRLQQVGKTAILWIHHAGKDDAKGARGHSLLRAATDTEIEITAEGPQRMAQVKKQREMDCDGVFAFTLKVVELGLNKRGKPVTSCVVEGSDAGHTAGAVLAPKLKGHTGRALSVLHDLLSESGRADYPGVPMGLPSVPEDWWRQRFYDRTIDDGKADVSQNGKRMAFNRAVQDLADKRLVGVTKGRVWACRPAQTPAQKAAHFDD